ncbi:hypothetical protein ES703_64520 [subsurface metagenome]
MQQNDWTNWIVSGYLPEQLRKIRFLRNYPLVMLFLIENLLMKPEQSRIIPPGNLFNQGAGKSIGEDL